MQKIAGACVMEWSMQLEKGLRSNVPGRAMDALLQIGPRLGQLGADPGLTLIECNLFGLIPGEDRLFANSILLRLADAFRSGDIHIRHGVAKVFLSALRHRGRKSGQDNGILAKHRVDNPVELLRRIKAVLPTEDIESRALALIIFGCFADFSIDSAAIRIVILMGLASSHDLEVRASLFAAKCFCKISSDFASAVLEIIVELLTKSKASPTVKLAVARAFSKFGCSTVPAIKLYKTGVKLLRENVEDKFIAAMMISLSKLAATSTFFMSEQVDLLFSFITQESTLHVKEIAFKCLQFLFRRGVCCVQTNTHSIVVLSSMLDKPELPLALQCEALQILPKVLLHSLPGPHSVAMVEFPKLLTVVKNINQYSIMSARLLVIRALIDILYIYKWGTEMESIRASTTSWPSQVLLLISDQIIQLAKAVLELDQIHYEMERECQSWLKLLLFLVKQHPDLCVLAINKIIELVEYVVNRLDNVANTMLPGPSIYITARFKVEKSTHILSKLMSHVFRFVMVCLENLGEGGALTPEVFQKVKFLTERVHNCCLFDCYTRTIYSLLLHYLIAFFYLINKTKDTSFLYDPLGRPVHNILAEQEVSALECVKEVLAVKDNWRAYRAGRYAACQGAWSVAAFIFEKLMANVESDSYSCWLRSLALFAHAEMKFKQLLLDESSSLVVSLEARKSFLNHSSHRLGETSQPDASFISLPRRLEKIVVIHSILSSSRDTLRSVSDQSFCFQRWLLAIRTSFIGILVEIMKLLGNLPIDLDNISNDGKTEGTFMAEHLTIPQQISSLLYHLTQISLQLKGLSQELDLIVASFIDIDAEGLKIISSLALSCSILSFCASFTLLILHLPANKYVTSRFGNLGKNSHAILIQNFIERLWYVDPETSMNLRSLFKITGQPKRCFHLVSRNQVMSIDCVTRNVLGVCGKAVQEIIGLQAVAYEMHEEEILSQFIKGFKVLLDVVEKWMHIPFQIPKYFFQVRQTAGSELFVSEKDSRDRDGLSILPGSHLSLDLCIQLQDMPSHILARRMKLYCILHCSTLFQMPEPHVENEGQEQQGFQACETDSIVDLNQRLLHYVMECVEKTSSECGRNNYGGNDGNVYEFVHFKLNGRGQGFSTCLPDVTAFPAGTYRIKWHSCCIDNAGRYWSLLPLNNGPVFTVQKLV